MLSCETEPPKPTNPIFSDVEKVEITDSDPYYFKSFPSYVKYIQFLVFSTQPIADDDNKVIKNMSDLLGGNRTGLSGISRAQVNEYHVINAAGDDFIEGNTLTIDPGDWYVVLGFDEDYNLTHASPAYEK